MKIEEIIAYYLNLTREDKAQFIKFLETQTGKKYRTWQQYFSRAHRKRYIAPLSVIEMDFLTRTVKNEEWRIKN